MNNNYIKPILFDLTSQEGIDNFNIFKKENSDVIYIDTLNQQKYELNLIRNPKLISHSDIYKNNSNSSENIHFGTWVYFPWSKKAIRILDENDYSELRLSRNHDLITLKEEKILKKSIIAVAGLNVGNPGAICFALEGIASKIKLADFDPLSISNLNRFRAGLSDIGVNKAIISARQMYEINPFLDIEVLTDGVTDENITSFLSSPKIDLLIEETDNLKLKINIREMAKKFEIPVLMVTGNGENVLVDVERYDLDKDLTILSGYLTKNIIRKILFIKKGEGDLEDRIILARDFMGKEYLDSRLVNSFDKVGKTLSGIPQLAESSFLRGAVICHFAKKIILKEDLPSGRYEILLSGLKIKKNDKGN